MSSLTRSRSALLAPVLLLIAACQTTGAARSSPRDREAAEEFARRALAAEQSLEPSSLPERTVGVAPLAISSSDSGLASLGYGLADLLMTDLARSSQLRVVDRLRLDALLREMQFVQTSRDVDSSSAARVGGLVGARRLVVGSITPLPDRQLRIDVRIADAATGTIRPAVFSTASLEDILRAQKALTFEIFEQLGVTLTPAERLAIEQRATQNLAALLAYSRGVRYEVEGRFDRAAGEFQTAVQLDGSFSMARSRLGAARAMSGASSVSSIARAAGIAAERLNQGLIASTASGARPGSAADPTFPAYSVTILVTITTPP